MCRDGFRGECPECGAEITCRDSLSSGCADCDLWMHDGEDGD